MAVSINDIAKAAKVSTATVSRVINNSTNITPKTKERVLSVMKDMNYVPNSLARGLSNRKALNVALIIDIDNPGSFYNPFFSEVMHGIETAVYKKGLCLIIASSKRADIEETLETLILGKRIQGVFVPNSLADPNAINNLINKKFPFIGIGEIEGYKNPVSWVDINNQQGGEHAVEHLVEQGYRNIGFIGGSQEKLFNKNRLLGYKHAMIRNGLNIHEEYIKVCDGTKQDAYKKMNKMISMDAKLDAVICGDNIITYGVMKAVFESKKNIPNDIGIVSFDRYPLATLVEPSITTVDIDVFQLGELAANLLLKLIENPAMSQQQSLISTCVEIRDSTRRGKDIVQR
jgi:DNA-binding LacI/PurR family transcriptional regulator